MLSSGITGSGAKRRPAMKNALDSPAPTAQSDRHGLARTSRTGRNRAETGAERACRAAHARPAAGHGHPQRHAGFLLRRRPVPRPGRGHRPCRRDGRTGRRHPRYRRGIRPGPMAAPSRSRPTTRWRGWRRSCRRSSSSACRCRSTPSRPPSPPGRSTRVPPSSTTSGACSAIPTWRRWSPRAACR